MILRASVERSLTREIRLGLKRHTADLVEFASSLIKIASENPPGAGYAKCAALIASRLRQLGLTTRTVTPSGAPIVTGTYGEGGRALYFSGHYDVVPAQSAEQFKPLVRKSNLHGRGSADMKGGIAAMAFAIHALKEIGFEPSGRVISVSVPDEETSGPRGTVALAETGLIEGDALGMLTMEPTGGVIWNGNRGVITLRITVRGRPAHVGMHFRGVNAFRGMLDVADEFVALEREVAERRTELKIAPDAARRSVLLLGGELSGGHLFNAVPDRVSFTVDRRTNPEENFDAERERLLAIVTRACERGLKVTVEELQQGRPSATSAKVPLARALATSVRSVTGKAARFELCPGVLETRHYAALGVPALAYGPGLLSISHGPNEFVSIPKLLDCAEVYARTAVRVVS